MWCIFFFSSTLYFNSWTYIRHTWNKIGLNEGNNGKKNSQNFIRTELETMNVEGENVKQWKWTQIKWIYWNWMIHVGHDWWTKNGGFEQYMANQHRTELFNCVNYNLNARKKNERFQCIPTPAWRFASNCTRCGRQIKISNCELILWWLWIYLTIKQQKVPTVVLDRMTANGRTSTIDRQSVLFWCTYCNQVFTNEMVKYSIATQYITYIVYFTKSHCTAGKARQLKKKKHTSTANILAW